ncbi:tRNA glutamyl-Q(34) synthetase GluQRS [Mameliella sp. CS4]|uniref:tRNA glutamyl-Q(34) synthetase GluQRS n=1 Tax=Mameliella sp. CS4 TaxID=2862329 RepID=UPI001C5E3F3C|nr:tRNA glutamyl-Q(34) synthetase GluQRS [uncultured Mameliella sp.]MBW4983370.1 tRNA glutamyl-Q(34) synthetase GluQRS [Mameliella sp. CS4]
MIFTTRFAPSPTGPLHLGHAYSALLAHDLARAAAGRFLLRIEDIDHTRSRPEWERQILEDLTWLGVTWDALPMRQSDRTQAYGAALQELWSRGLLYACSCTRRDIAAAVSAPQEGAEIPHGPDGLIYPGTCRHRYPRDTAKPPDGMALRLDMAAALAALATPLAGFVETGPDGRAPGRRIMVSGDDLTSRVGDIVLSRKDFFGSYHLSVVLDDAAQAITHVIRGEDLFDATQIHVLLQALLRLETPVYLHHRLIRDETGRRLAKRDDARAIATYRAEGRRPQEIREMVGLTA